MNKMIYKYSILKIIKNLTFDLDYIKLKIEAIAGNLTFSLVICLGYC